MRALLALLIAWPLLLGGPCSLEALAVPVDGHPDRGQAHHEDGPHWSSCDAPAIAAVSSGGLVTLVSAELSSAEHPDPMLAVETAPAVRPLPPRGPVSLFLLHASLLI